MAQSVDNMKKNGSYGYVYDFPVGYDNANVPDILKIGKHLIVKNNVNSALGL